MRRLTLAVSWLCDCRCQMCGIWKIYAGDPGGHRREMPASETLRLLAEAESLRSLETITFTGGEPFIHKEFATLGTTLAARFPRAQLDVTTTGQATAAIQERLEAMRRGGADLRRMHVSVSLDGIGEQHDAIRGRAGAFDRAMRTVAMLRTLPLGGVALGFTILPANHGRLREAYRLSVAEGVGFTMRAAHFNPGFYANADAADEHRWTAEALSSVEASVRAIIDDKRRRRGVARLLFGSDLYFAEQMLEYLRAPRRLMPCYSGTHSAVIDPHGNVAPCVNLEQSMGSAREQGFDAVWRSRDADEIRRFIADARCHCWTECESYLSFHTSPRYLLYNLDALRRRVAGPAPCPEPV